MDKFWVTGILVFAYEKRGTYKTIRITKQKRKPKGEEPNTSPHLAQMLLEAL